jgi:peroxiredoxin
MENPNVVQVYNKYKNKGFDILSVSLDKTKEAWLKAIEEDGLRWNHVSDLGFWQSAIVPVYNINSIPMTFLVDPNGIIIAKNLRGEALENKLAELLQ